MRDESEGIVVESSGGLRGTVRVPADKSITHRAMFLGAINVATTTIVGPSPAEDCARTLRLVVDIGRDVELEDDRVTIADGEARNDAAPLTIDCGNSGTTARLAMGLLSAEPGRFTLVGDASLSRRPMERVAIPLRRIGASISTTDGTLPALIDGNDALAGGDSHGLIAVESAQVHAALVLAALRSRGGATLFTARPMRDHTLRMMRAFGCEPASAERGVHRIMPSCVDRDVTIDVPGDVSSAAFLVTAAVLVPESEIVVEQVGLNPTRTAYLRALMRMGADVTVEVESDAIEPRGRIVARHSPSLRGAEFFADDDECPIAEMIDELPLLALVATRAEGHTIVRDASELRVKESDRIAATIAVLEALGATAVEREDGFEVDGPQSLDGGSTIDPAGDHRLAMMGAIGALIALRPTTIVDAGVASVSYPSFWSDLERLGASVRRN